MVLTTIDESQRSAARIAGVTLLLGTAIVFFGTYYLSAGLYVPNDPARTAANILTQEIRFRLHLACNLAYALNITMLAAALYAVLKPVDRGLALAAAFCRLLYAAVWIYVALDMLGAMRLLGGSPYLHVLATDQLQALARARLSETWDAYCIGLPFWAAASTFCAYLWFKSRYIPRVLAAYGVVASAWCTMCAFVFLVFPNFSRTVDPNWYDAPMALFEIVTGFWLLLRGLRPQTASDAGRIN
jgi:hypothetical protein